MFLVDIINFLKIKPKKEILISILVSLHIFFWDLKIFGLYGPREFISILILVLFYDIIKKKLKINKNDIKNLIFISLFLIFVSIHLFLNVFIDKGEYFRENILGLLGVYILSISIYFYYNIIIKNLSFIIYFFIFIFILIFPFSEFKILSEWEKIYSGYCITQIGAKHLIFGESSHLGMLIGGVFAFILLNNKERSIIFFLAIHAILTLILFLFTSITVFFSITSAYFLIFILEPKFFLKKLVYYLAITSLAFIFLNSTEKYSANCQNKIQETLVAFSLVEEKVSKENTQSKKIENPSKIDERIKKVRNNELPVSNHHFRFNLTTSVFINAINISIETLKERVFGWGLNRYESAFDFYMHNQIVIPYFYHEVYTLNYNDGSANLPKLITEFGYLSIIFLGLIFLFLFNNNLSTSKKIFFLSLIGTQLLRGAGYFNGGFIFSFIIIIYTIFDLKFKKDNN